MNLTVSDIRFTLDPGAVSDLNSPAGIVGEGTLRAAERTAQRIRDKIRRYDLVDTGEMLNDVQANFRESSDAGAVASAGTPNVEYTLYQREPFLLEALLEATPADWEQ